MSRNLYNNPDIKRFSSDTENQNFDRKSATIAPKDLATIFSAFANKSLEGGLVVVGIRDKKLYGINEVGQEKINRLIQTQNTFCPLLKVKYKELPIINYKGKEDKLLLFFIEYSSDKVIKLPKGEAYERVGDKTIKMGAEEIKQMEYEKQEKRFEEEIVPGLFIHQLNVDLLNRFIRKWVERDGLKYIPSIEDLILMKGFGKKNGDKIEINNAGLLLFHDHPELFIPGAKIRFLKYEGRDVRTGERSNIIKDIIFSGPITKQIEQFRDMFRVQIREFSFLNKDGKFGTVPEYPEFAWYEAIVNAVAHRSYSIINSCIFFRIFDDRAEIQSPGNLPGIVTVENIYNVNFPRNSVLMQALLYLGYVKSASEGVDRIKDEMTLLDLPEPIFYDDEKSFLFGVTLKNDINKRKLIDRLSESKRLNKEILERLDEDEKKIVYYLLKNEVGGPIDFEKETEKTRATVVRKLRHLETLRVVLRTKKLGPGVKYKLTPVISVETKRELNGQGQLL